MLRGPYLPTEVRMRFRGLLLALVALFSLFFTLPAQASQAGAWVVHSQQLDNRLVELTVHSDAVGHDVGVRILLPPDYRKFPHRDWPTLYLLHGCCDDTTGFQSWTTKTDVEAFTAHTNVLIVMPEGGTGGFYSDWLDGPKWETFHLTELRRLLERQYHSGQQRVV